jgi:MFS family permease
VNKLFGYAWFTTVMPELVVWMIYLKSQGWTTAQVAILEGTFTLCSALFELPSGMIADKIGRKLSLQIGELLCVVYLISYFFPQNRVILYDKVGDKQKYLKYLGYFNGIQILGTAFGNSIGGWLSQISWSFLFVTAIVIRVIAVLLVSSVDEDNIVVEDDGPFKVVSVLRFVRESKKFRRLLVCIAFSESAITLSYQYGPLLFSKEGLHTGYVSVVFGLISLLGAAAAVLAERASNKLGKKLLILLFSVSILSFVLIYTAHSQVLLIVILFMIPNIIYELWSPILESELQMISRESIRASAFSLINLVTSLILTLGSYVVGITSEDYSILQIVSVGCSLLIVVSFVSYLFLMREYAKE